MLLYLFKRLVLILPTVWIISSLVFLLSRILPGTHAEVVAEAMEADIGSAGKKMDRSLYLSQIGKQGLDKPLFYFSVTNLAQPDTLFRVFPVQHQQLLQNLLNRYGNWPKVAAYYQSLRALQDNLALQNNALLATLLPENINAGLRVKSLAELAVILESINLKENSTRSQLAQIKLRFNQMQQQAQPVNLFIPDVRWHGSQNQYHHWFTRLLRGNLGYSYRDQQPVMRKIKEAIGNTLILLTLSIALTFLFSVELSLILCRWQKGQSVVLNILYLLDSIPVFLLAMLFITFLVGTGLVNDSYVLGNLDDDIFAPVGALAVVTSQVQKLWLPTLCLVLTGMPYITTQIFRVLQQQLNSEFIKTARSKGLSEARVLRKHAFRNALLPLITLFTGYLPVIIGGAVVVEIIFVLPGSGSLLTDSMYARDYPVVIGLVSFLAVLKAGAHILADALYFAVDPRTHSHLA